MRYALSFGVAGIVVAVVAAVGGAEARAAGGGRAGEIVFQKGVNPAPAVAVVRAKGGGLRTLVSDAGSPVWSPNGKQIAFVEWASGTGATIAIEVANADGSHVRTLARGTGVGAPAWSPDGKRIAFERPSGNYYGVYVVNANGSALRRLLSNASAPAWSPDGKQIAFVRTSPSGGVNEIEIANASGAHARKLVGGYVGKPAWSPNGSKIAFEDYITVMRGSSGYPIPEIDVINVDGSGQRQLTKRVQLQGNLQPTWSPDGRQIAFTRDHCFPESICQRAQQVSNDLYVMNADGSHQTKLEPGGTAPDWRHP